MENTLMAAGLWGDQAIEPKERPGVHLDATGDVVVIVANPAARPGEYEAAVALLKAHDWTERPVRKAEDVEAELAGVKATVSALVARLELAGLLPPPQPEPIQDHGGKR